ncbi:MAG: hypothetical protein UZ17_ACD001000997 [Acidobacteria bacterium OLB17]|nr:MAG: hypothetical protein UZ17_ACD001000997 [Acidobacteria bacterium OLB17]MCZ2391074.1 choice-of-anchor D domain-containing protein [Acidobacteriota bacterium]
MKKNFVLKALILAAVLLATLFVQDSLLQGHSMAASINDGRPAGLAITFSDNTACCSLTPNIDVSPTAGSFGNQTVGTTSSALIFTIQNAGDSHLRPGTYALNGANPGDFSVQNFPSNQNLPGGSQISFSVFFTPTAVGSRSANIVFPTNVPGQPTVSIPIVGTGTSAPTPTPVPVGNAAFTYQGKLLENGVNVTGPRNLKFRLFDDSTNTQVGSDVILQGVNVSDGIFTVLLDFGTAAYSGASRSLEISVSYPAANAFTTLSPRQTLTAAPYAVRSIVAGTADNAVNTQQLGGVAASQYVTTNDPRMSDPRDPTAGSASYVQNQNASPQALANFSIDGTGQANILSATTQFNLGSNRILGNGGYTDSLFAGVGAGSSVTTGSANTFIGMDAGQSNTTGISNTFVGLQAGQSNVSGNWNTFVGLWAGLNNTSGLGNNFYGSETGRSNTIGNTNNFFGGAAGLRNTTGSNNTFIGEHSGDGPTSGDNNTTLGAYADIGNSGLNYATAIGAGATVYENNMIALGRSMDSVRVVGKLLVNTLGPAASTKVCWNSSTFQLSTCSTPLADGDQLVEFNGALAPASLVNALKEQQAKIDAQAKQIEQLRKLVCSAFPTGEGCTDAPKKN